MEHVCARAAGILAEQGDAFVRLIAHDDSIALRRLGDHPYERRQTQAVEV
jgi:hypothetical protein